MPFHKGLVVIRSAELSSEDVLLLAKIASRLGFEVQFEQLVQAPEATLTVANSPAISEKCWIGSTPRLGVQQVLGLIREGYTLITRETKHSFMRIRVLRNRSRVLVGLKQEDMRFRVGEVDRDISKPSA